MPLRFGREKRAQPDPVDTRQGNSGGVLVALITPRRTVEIEADLAALFDLIDFVTQRGAAGIVLYGSTGEFLHYSLDERARVTNLCVKRSRVPLFVNVTHSTFEGTVYLAEAAAAANAAGLLAMPPYFFQYGPEDIETYYLALAGIASRLAPLYLYNIPFFTSPIPAGLSARLLGTGLFAGIKDSSGEWDYFETLSATRRERDFALYVGNDKIFARARQAGAAGVVSGIASAFPELLVAIDKAAVAGDAGRVSMLDVRLQEFIGRLDGLPAPVVIREAAALRGIRPGPHAAPLGEIALKRLYDFREWFPAWLNATLKECQGG
jgi:4-hydroxy-tetrahydrodipicolinate synthase